MEILRIAIRLPLLVTGLLTALPIVVLAGCARSVSAAVNGLADLISGRRARSGWRELVEYDAGLGWRPKPNLQVTVEADHVYRLTTGADGWRGSTSLDEAEVVVFGDSFAYGHGCDDAALFTNFAGGIAVKPIGTDGYQMVHGLLWMRRLEQELRGKTVIWFVYYGNDLHENLVPSVGPYRMPFVCRRRGEWQVVADHVSREPWTFPHPGDYSGFMADFSTPGAYSDKVFSACEFLIREASQLCDRAGAELVVFGVPDRSQLASKGIATLRSQSPTPEAFDVTLPDQRLGAICRGVGVRFHALREHLSERDYLLADIHWTPAGHRKVGALVAAAHRRVSSHPAYN